MLEHIKLGNIANIAFEAGQHILNVYHSDEFSIETKEDQSPLTLADKQSHESIVAALEKNYPDIPILSEEGNHMTYDERKGWDTFWLVDPLDGTKEFIKRNGEFTVNIALIQGTKPVLGVIYAPALDTMYIAKENVGAYKLIECQKNSSVFKNADLMTRSVKLPVKQNGQTKIRVIASRSHSSKETNDYIKLLEVELQTSIEKMSVGSSLKLCMIAEGTAQYYPRFAPTMEWDTGAGQAIVEQAGGKVINYEDGEPLRYNKEILRNPWFLAKGHMDY